MPKFSDLLQTGLSAPDGIRWCHVDVTDSVRALNQAHLSGPTAALVLGEALAGVVLLSHELTQAHETLSLGLQVDGALKGLLVEATKDGALRGYTKVKILNDLDGREEITSRAALGDSGKAHFIRSVPGRIISRAGIDIAPPNVQNAVNRYLNQSLQRVAFSMIQVFASEGGVDQARAFLVESLPDGNQREYKRLRGCLEDGSLSQVLEVLDSGQAVCEELGMRSLSIDTPRPLRFACRCSPARAEAILAALQPGELREMAATGKSTDIFCHMCGRMFTFSRDQLLQLADRVQSNSGAS